MACDFTNYFAEIENTREIESSPRSKVHSLVVRKVITAVWL